jgi:hypothetical protein
MALMGRGWKNSRDRATGGGPHRSPRLRLHELFQPRPGTSMPKTRYWVVLNNQFRPPPEAVRPDWRSVLPRGLDASSRSATVSAMRHLFSLAAVLRIEYGADVGSPCCANCKPDGCAPRRCRSASC